MSAITIILSRTQPGDLKAAEALRPLVYAELRKLAVVRMANEKTGQTLQPTARAHEAWRKLAGDGQPHFANRRHFFKAAAGAMQQMLIDIARRKQRLKHGANLVGDEPHESRIAMSVPSEELLAVNDALAALALADPQAAEVVQMRYFVGMTVPEVSAALDLAPRTVDRHWAFARAWLKRTIRESLGDRPAWPERICRPVFSGNEWLVQRQRTGEAFGLRQSSGAFGSGGELAAGRNFTLRLITLGEKR